MALIDKLTAIADAVRAKTGGTELLTLDQMAAEIAGITAGGENGVTVFDFTPDEDTNSFIFDGVYFSPIRLAAVFLPSPDNYTTVNGTILDGCKIDNDILQLGTGYIRNRKLAGNLDTWAGSMYKNRLYVNTYGENTLKLNLGMGADVMFKSGVTYRFIYGGFNA